MKRHRWVELTPAQRRSVPRHWTRYELRICDCGLVRLSSGKPPPYPFYRLGERAWERVPRCPPDAQDLAGADYDRAALRLSRHVRDCRCRGRSCGTRTELQEQFDGAEARLKAARVLREAQEDSSS